MRIALYAPEHAPVCAINANRAIKSAQPGRKTIVTLNPGLSSPVRSPVKAWPHCSGVCHGARYQAIPWSPTLGAPRSASSTYPVYQGALVCQAWVSRMGNPQVLLFVAGHGPNDQKRTALPACVSCAFGVNCVFQDVAPGSSKCAFSYGRRLTGKMLVVNSYYCERKPRENGPMGESPNPQG